jgi:hypothetical protein
VTAYQPQPGDRVTVTRVMPDRSTAVLVGVYQPSTLDDSFCLNGQPLTDCATVARLYGHLGCTQRITPAD